MKNTASVKNILVDDEKGLKESTEDFFAKQYAHLCFSSNNKQEMSFEKAFEEDDKTILVTNEVVTYIDRPLLNQPGVSEPECIYKQVFIDYFYLLELASRFETKIVVSEKEDSLLDFELTWSQKEFFEPSMPKRTRIY